MNRERLATDARLGKISATGQFWAWIHLFCIGSALAPLCLRLFDWEDFIERSFNLLTIAKALQTANIDDPLSAEGKVHDQTVMSEAYSLHLAKAAIRGMNAAGFAVVSTIGSRPSHEGEATLV